MRKLLVIFMLLLSGKLSAAPIILKSDVLSIPADGKTICTTQLQQAIDRISKRGGGTLVLTPGTYLSGSIFLKLSPCNRYG
uniref:hypothetical protein n=1 Tax=Segatella hominis TaxID=2518605 RepID=UPI00402531BE